jgi:hypothetical protein
MCIGTFCRPSEVSTYSGISVKQAAGFIRLILSHLTQSLNGTAPAVAVVPIYVLADRFSGWLSKGRLP